MSRIIDVVILTINGISDTQECINALYDANDQSLFRLIVVDQGSGDGTIDYLNNLEKRKQNMVIFQSNLNLGFGLGCNKGASLGNSKYILFLNNDALLPTDGLKRMIAAMEENELDAMGPMSNETGEIQKYWGPYDVAKYQKERVRVDEYLCQAYGNQTGSFHRLAGFCMMVSRTAFETVNGFSNQYGVGYYEDDDLSYRLRVNGYKLGVAPGIFVHHHGSRAFKKAGLSPNKLIVKNRLIFLRETYFSFLTKPGKCHDKVTVIIATMNRPDQLKNAIQSVLDQTYSDIEIIVVNDGGISLEATVESFSDKRIMLFELADNMGKSFALNYAVERASGVYIAYLDDDDLYFPHHLQTLVNAITICDADFVYSDSEVRVIKINGKEEISFITDNEFDITKIEFSNFIPNLAVLHKNNAQYRHDDSLRTIEDWDFLRKAALEWGAEFVHVPILTHVFYVREDAQSRNGARYKNPTLYFDTLARIRTRGGWWTYKCITSETIRADSLELASEGQKLTKLSESLKLNKWNSLSQNALLELYYDSSVNSLPEGFNRRYITGYPATIRELKAEMMISSSSYDLDRIRQLGELALLYAPTPYETAWVYRALSRGYANDAITSELCYKRAAWLIELRNYEVELAGSWVRRYNRFVNKYKSEGIRGIVKTILKRFRIGGMS